MRHPMPEALASPNAPNVHPSLQGPELKNLLLLINDPAYGVLLLQKNLG